MQLKVQESLTLHGEIIPPSSKSQSIRGMMFALLSNGTSTLDNTLDSDDTQDAMKVCKELGLKIIVDDHKMILSGNGLPLETEAQHLHSGNSGITTRFIMPILGLRKNSHQPIILNCGEQMRARPIRSLVDALRRLGLTIEYLEGEGVLPVAISGKLIGGKTEVDGLTSQYLSALLISLPCAENDSEVIVRNLHERPYMEMTLNWLRHQNIVYTHDHHNHVDVYNIKGKQSYQKFHATIAGDFSSASYLIAAAALTKGSVVLQGLDMQDPQGDKRLVPILQEMGADIVVESHRLVIRGGKPLKGIKIDANDVPDLVPTLAVIGTQALGKTEIVNVAQARIKETDRIHSMTDGLTRLGAKVEEFSDGMSICNSPLRGAEVRGYGDHRTVMALSIAGMLAQGATIIDDGIAINKTFPNYVEIMQSLGAKMEMINETVK